ncbi:hypothetical protein Tco_0668803 [Tanacetum coccineum]
MLPLVHLSFHASACSLSTIHFLKILENSLEVLKVLKSSLEVLKVLKNSLEVLKVLQMELQENLSIDEVGTETTPPGRSIGQNNRATTPSHLTTNPVTTTALITSRRCHSPVIDPPLPSPLVNIVDFLNASSIRYSLTVNPTVYVSYIKQFWSTAKTKTANNETQIYAKVVGKSVVVTESSFRSDLHFNDEDGTTCLTTIKIFENLTLMGYERDSDKLSFVKALFSPYWKYLIHTILHCLSSKSTAWNEFSTNVASAVICLAKGQKFNFSKLIFDEEGEGSRQPSEPQPTPSPTLSFHKEQLSDIPSSSKPQKTQKHRKGKKLSNRVLDLEKAMIAQAKEIAILKKRVKKLEKRKRSKTQGLKLFKIGKPYVKGDAEQVVIAAVEVVNTGVSVSTAEPKTPPTTTTTLLEDDEEQREGKAPMVEEDISPPKKTQKQLDDERARLEEAMRLQAKQEAEHAEQIHLDRLFS